MFDPGRAYAARGAGARRAISSSASVHRRSRGTGNDTPRAARSWRKRRILVVDYTGTPVSRRLLGI
eukprot:3199494-Prymnesium_polylepis.1